MFIGYLTLISRDRTSLAISQGFYCSDIITALRPLCACSKLIEPDLFVDGTSEPSTNTRKGPDRNLFGTATVVRPVVPVGPAVVNCNSITFLSGRDIVFKPKVVANTQETGKVVVNIWVDRYGKVKRATPGAKGSTTTSSSLYKIAKEAAIKAKFSPNRDAPEEQKGTLVFDFKLRQ